MMGYLQDSSTMVDKARRRWRVAYSTIKSARAIMSSSTQMMTKNNTINVPKKRWQVAFAAIYSFRAIASLSKNVISQNNHPLLHSPSFVAIQVEPDKFFSNVNISSITKVVKDKDHDTLHELGGVDGLMMLLQTDEWKGINGNHEDISRGQKAFGCNMYHTLKAKRFCHFVLIAMKDPIIITLLICAILSLGFNIVGNGLKHGWYDGGSMLIAVLVVVTVCSVSHFWPYRQFNKLSQMSRENHIEVVRNGQQQQVLVSNIVVGDVVSLRSGNSVPADGLVVSAHSSLQIDESSLGEDNNQPVRVDQALNLFLFAGTKVESGHGKMLVTSVGENTKWGEIMSLLGSESYKWRSLESKLLKLTNVMSLVGFMVAVSTLIILLYRYFSGHMKNRDGRIRFAAGETKASNIWNEVVGILVSTVAVASSAIPEGLPLAVAIVIACTMKGMIKNQALFRQFSTCVQLASTSILCIDTTDIVTGMDKMKLKFWLGEEFIDAGSSSQLIAANVRHLLRQGVGLNTSQTRHKFSEEAIVCWATTELSMDVQELREGFDILHAETLSEDMKQSKIIIRKEGDHTTHVHLKGEAEEIILKCSYYYGVEGTVKGIEDNTRRKIEHTVQGMAQEGFKCIAYAHKVLKIENHDNGEFQQQLQDDSFVLLALIGLKHTILPEVTKAIQDCKQAGVYIKLITSVDSLTATTIASECGILHRDEEFNNGEVMEGLEFRSYTSTERIEKVDKICVMAKATSSDKLLLVQCLKQNGHVVAVTGNNISDAPALKEADVAIHMGFQDGNNIAIENSDVVVLNEGFVSVFAVLKVWRGVYDNIKVFIQYLLAANLASLVTDFVSTVSADQPPTLDILAGVSVKEVPYAVLQILWLKLIIGTLAALALVVEQKTEFMQEPPTRPDQPVISNKICKNILIHATYEIAILLTFQFKSEKILGLNGDVKDALVFNLLVLFQVFAILKARKPKGNIFKLQRRKLFWGIICGIVILQVAMLKFLAKLTGAGDLNWWQWCASICIAFTSWPIEYVGNKYIPAPKMSFMF